MALAPTLNSPAALYRKLEREAYRAYHSRSRLHKADHFFNFCVTAHAMRDYCLEYLGKTDRDDKKPFHRAWDNEPTLVAAKEIANSSKHFVLRDTKTGITKVPLTRGVRTRRSSFVDVYSDGKGQVKVLPVDAPDVSIRLSDGTVLLLYQFTGRVIDYWRAQLSLYGIKVRRQSIAGLVGRGAQPSFRGDCLPALPAGSPSPAAPGGPSS